MNFPRARLYLVAGIICLLLLGIFEIDFKVFLVPLYTYYKLAISFSYGLLFIWILYQWYYHFQSSVIITINIVKKTSERVAVFVDASNVYGIVKDSLIQKSENLKIEPGVYKGNLPQNKVEVNNAEQKKSFYLFDLIRDIVGSRNCVVKCYYTGEAIYNGNEPFFVDNIKLRQRKQREWFTLLEKHGFIVRKGRVETFYNEGKVFQKEKGVDIIMALDIYEGAFFDRYDTAIIISSDNDFYPVFEEIKALGKEVEYISFGKNESRLLRKIATRTVAINYQSYIKEKAESI